MTLEAKIKGVVDFVILIDISGSMQGCIDAVKQSVSTLLNDMTSTDVNGAL
jgi:Mg-chelatase subunit ChlD